MPKAGEGFGFFGFGSTNMPRRRRWGRTPCQNHFAMEGGTGYEPVLAGNLPAKFVARERSASCRP
jgi:hypothetical protein